jgi:LuxR family transcriptional regulator, maltose regulon positive regulatory protein
MSELATRPVQRELRPFRVHRDGPGNVAIGPWPEKGAAASAEEPGAPDVLAAPPVGAGVVSRFALFRRLAEAERVVQISAPAGSGKTVLMRSWIAEAGLAQHAAWVPVDSEERDPQRFWLSVLGALRETAPGAVLVRTLTAAPDLDGWAIVERLLTDLAPLADRIWLVIDDVHELGPDVLRQLELLVLRAPPDLRLVLATRHDLRLGLHRLRLEGELTEIREPDLRFTVAEARALLATAGVQLPDATLVRLRERTEGWAAGLRLAALSLAGHPDPARFAAGFSGTERTVAEYLLDEVLDRQSEEVRQLLLRTSNLERVNGELADLLTGYNGGERVLQDLEQANAFVISLDGSRSWFRYHRMFAGLLQLELRRAASDEVAALHRTAAGWLAAHGYWVEAIRHAQAAGDWDVAAGLLVDHWPGLYLDGQAATTHELLTGFPPGVRAADAGLAAVVAADELAYGSLEAAERYLGLAERRTASVPDARAQLLLGIVRLLVVRQRGDLSAVAEEVRRLETLAEAPAEVQPGLGEDLCAWALISLGITEVWTGRFQEAERHLGRGVGLAHRIGRPFLEFTGLAHLAAVEMFRSYAQADERSRQAIEMAERHGWVSDPAAGIACMALGTMLTWQGRLDEAEPWVQRAERTLTAEAQPATGHAIRYIRGLLELARGRDADTLAAFRAAEPLARQLAASHYTVPRARALMAHALVRLGDTEGAEQALAELGGPDRDHGETRIATALLRLAQNDPQAAVAALAPVLDGAPSVLPWIGLAHAFLLEAIARDALGDQAAAGRALERALDLAEPDGALTIFLLHPAPGLLERHARHGTAHAALIAEVQSLLAGNRSAPRPGSQAGWARSRGLDEQLTHSEIRVLRYLPTQLTGPEIADELFLSVNTVSTHTRHLYAKLGVHSRREAVDRARALGLLAPSAQRA